MHYQMLIGKFNEYLHSAMVALSTWLGKRLPNLNPENWWQSCVLDKLSFNQMNIVEASGAKSLSDLDLSALLRVADKNWYSIREKFFLNFSERAYLKAMFAVRNNWAHCGVMAPTVDSVITDLEALIDFLSNFEADKGAIADAEKLLSIIKNEGISDIPQMKPTPDSARISPETASFPTGITVNSVVHLKSNPTTRGVVTAARTIGGTQQFDVFIDGKIKAYFADQIEAEQQAFEVNTVDITDLLKTLTAYQIIKPSSESLYSLNAARVDFVPYQFRPALKLIKSDSPRLLIADSVGVGKTIEAGLILKEMQARTPLDNVLIICPKPLVAERKWETEMKRFDEDFVSVTGDELRHIIADADRDGAWPDRYKRLIVPYSLLNEDLLEGTGTGRKRTFGVKNLDPAPFFDMIIVDEAHHIRNSSTQTHKAVKFFCEHSNAAIFLTATPLQLGNEDLYTLLNLLFPDEVIDKATFAAMSEPNPYINAAIHNLRFNNHESEALAALNQAANTEWGRAVITPNPLYKQAVKLLSNGELTREHRVRLIGEVETLHSFSHMINRTRRQDIEDFCVRRAITLESSFTVHQQQLHDSLLEFEARALQMLHSSIPVKFLMSTISRQAASCIFGLAPALRSLAQKRLCELADEFDIDIDTIDFDANSITTLANEVVALAESLPPEDPKFDSLVEILREKQNAENNKAIIFSTFRHTLNYLKEKILSSTKLRVEQINGSVKDEDRYRLRERFALPQSDPQSIDILLFTEVGSEGLDYQFCDTIVNYDLPWNPMRIEQRIGRIDRRGQKSEVAHIYNCITSGTIDADIYNRCLSRIGVFEQSIGECSDILGNITDSIQKIVFDSTLTSEERSSKLEQLADNEVRIIEEMRRLEDDEKQMFGLDISGFVEDVEKAENPWLSPEALRRLIVGYLRSRLSSGKKYLSDKRLTLTMIEKEELYKDYKSLNIAQENSWARFLRSSVTNCKVVFEQDEAKDPKTIFITPVHPLVRQAATYFSDTEAAQTAVKVCSTAIAPGTYPFLLYAWEYTGNRPRVSIVAVCDNKEAQAELPPIIQSAVQCEAEFDIYAPDWGQLEESHLTIWQNERDKFRDDTKALCRFKVESLTKSVNARRNVAQNQLASATDQRIIAMRSSELERLEADYNAKKRRLEESAELSDIHITKLVNGILIVEG